MARPEELDEFGNLLDFQIVQAVRNIRGNNSIQEVIFGGGEPALHPRGLELALELLAEEPRIVCTRLHTRLPLQQPDRMDLAAFERIARLKRPPYVVFHADHADELTAEAVGVIETLRRFGFHLLCNTVLLRGVNDTVPQLQQLYSRMLSIGVRPYLVFHCQERSAHRLSGDRVGEAEMIRQLRDRMGAFGCPQYSQAGLEW